jgi:hypothetical protein
MRTQPVPRRAVQALIVVAAAVAVVLVGLELTEREASEDAAVDRGEPAVVEPVSGTGLSRVRLSASAAGRIGLETEPVESRGGRKVVPYSAILYDERGRTWVYTSPERLTFVRARVVIDAIRGDDAILVSGPPAGTEVASVAAAELYGTEFEVDH